MPLPLLLLAETQSASMNMVKIFQASPVIYSLLIFLFLIAASLWFYSMITLRLSIMMPRDFIERVEELLTQKRYNQVEEVCKENHNFASTMLMAGMESRKLGPKLMIEAVQTEGKRLSSALWQRIAMLNEIAAIAPTLGFLGSLLGLFFLFYKVDPDSEPSSWLETIEIVAGTTIGGFIVASFAILFFSTLKLKTKNLLKIVEEEVLSLIKRISPKTEERDSF